ncbi:hypothetical protein OEZ85_007610 [Tetradesmus obliquus]|uniref:TLC domain-containing protein n=1 Tax=Tetradesmus obliquus TaxID=3088 RepID=A0ABY8TGN2_TETOB|nr:hypothetical protein OEZ85_007610 [Tetradesmus obliquus]
MQLPGSHDPELLYTRTQLLIEQQAGQTAQLYKVLLLDCDAQSWQLASLQEEEHVCLANTAALRASCNQWLLGPPPAGEASSESCAPPSTAFGRYGDLTKRVLVLQAHWRINSNSTAAEPTALRLPDLQLRLGAEPAAAAADGHYTAAAAAVQPALLGSFVGSGIYPPSSLSHGLQAFSVQPSELQAISSADLACTKRCTYLQLGRMQPRPVNVVGYSFVTFDRAVAVAVEVQRGWAGRSAGHVKLRQMQWKQTQAASGGLVQLLQPFKLYPGDIVRWRCSYDTSDLQPGSTLKGGYSSAAGSLQEQCTVALHYWPRVEGLRGCAAATQSDALRGQDMCSNEVEDLLSITAAEQKELPIRRMLNEHAFPPGEWMGGWKATHILAQMAGILACLWASHSMLSSCKWLGSWHRRFHQLAPGQQRNVSLYVTHLLLDTATLVFVCRPMIELWLGLNEPAAAVRTGSWGFTYIVSCYALELTWRRRIDTMLAVHHVGTIIIILLYAGEFLANTARVANTIIVLGAFALMEQPTYVALLLKRMLPPTNRAVVTAARIGYISWFALKALSIAIAVRLLHEDWHLMPTWMKVNFVLTWIVASLVQGWSGLIQYGIYKQILRSYRKAQLQQQQALGKKPLLLYADPDGSSEDGYQGNMSPLLTPLGSDGSDDCIAAVDDEVLGADAQRYGKFAANFAAAAGVVAKSREHGELQLSPTSSGSDGDGIGLQQQARPGVEAGHVLLRSSSRGSGSGREAAAGDPLQQQGGSSGGGSGSSSARRQAAPTLQRRTRSGMLNMMECGLNCQDD